MRRIDGFFNIMLVVVFILVILVIAVGAYQVIFGPKEGYVINKMYTEARYSTVGTPHYTPEKYMLTIQNKDEDGDIVYGVIYVDSITFHTVKLNDYFSKQCMCVVKR